VGDVSHDGAGGNEGQGGEQAVVVTAVGEGESGSDGELVITPLPLGGGGGGCREKKYGGGGGEIPPF
jgi:hypothetical protein